jgi:SAM-dependent methyltransferase
MTTTADAAQASQPQDQAPSAAEQICYRVFSSGLGTAELINVHLGETLGLYRALSESGSQTSTELAERTNLDERYLREWLQGQAVAGYITAQGGDPASARWAVADGVTEALVDETSPFYVGALAATVPVMGRVMPLLVEAFHTGRGVPYSAYGPEAVTVQAGLNRPSYVNSLAAEWIPAIPAVEQRLRDETHPARVADLGCGVGWSAIELAKAFPAIRVDGYDNDEASIAQARRNAAEHGVADRVDFEVRDITRPLERSGYDLVAFFECVHDLPYPANALRTARQAVASDGTVLVMDERAAEEFTAPGDEVERFFAAFSPLWCLPQGRVERDSEAPGTLLRPSTLREFALRAGYTDVEILPIENMFWRFYRLHS